MAEDIHSQIVNDDEIHIPKGFTEAANDTIPSKNAVGTLEWINKDEVSGPQGPPGPPGSLASIVVADASNPVELTFLSDDDFGTEIIVKEEVPGGADIETIYLYDSNASTIPADGLYFVNTSKGGVTRWIAGQGAYEASGPMGTATGERYLSMSDQFNYGNDLSTGFKGDPPSLSINGGDNTKFDMTGGTLIHIDNSTVPPTITETIINPQIAVNPSFLATETASFISIDINGDIVQRTSKLTAEQRRDEATVGFVSHPDNLTIDTTVNTPQTTRNAVSQLRDLIEAVGFFSTSGNQVTGIAASLTLQKATGSGFALDENAEVNPKDPHNFNMPALNPMVMFQVLRDASLVNISATIDPTVWDNNGVLDTVPANNNATISYVYIFPNNQVAYLIGQQVFSTFAEAKDAAGTETVVLPSDISDSGLLLARIIAKKSALDTTNNTEVFILPSTAVSGGGASLTSLQQAYDISVDPEILTDSTRGALSLRRGSLADTDNVLEIEDGIGSIVTEFKGDGEINTEGQAYSKTNDLVDAANIATDCSLGNVHRVVLFGNRTLDNPTNMKDGATYIWIVTQDITGGRTLSFGTAFKFAGGTAPTLTTDPSAIDIISGVSDGINIYVNTGFDFK